MDTVRSHIMVCGGTGCVSSDSEKLITLFKEKLSSVDYDKEVNVIRTGCFGFCGQGPIVKIHPDNVFYVQVELDDVDEIVEEHIIKGRVVKRLLYEEPFYKRKVQSTSKMDFYKKQYRIALRNCGIINPEEIEEYIAFDGYEALGKVLLEMSPVEITNILK